MWKNADDYLKNVLETQLEVHGTVNIEGGEIPKFVINHGVLSGMEWHRLLRQVRLFLGLGFPYEGK